ncbi:MAG: hypothetical protein UV73_C0022G0010 [Candidatus Gottesmanbacteria bacterium GW2011_GWA2_43_14]|uniref:Aminopeptidase n=1 Tax=Candidatus Gottesmanbacteria bacterium GW2011_GWA2_43_14 TaxID=1618443 RepID=A0A0G1FJ94_9BACT|nr:MAG: hypothetical protein UV73_C0022G0010 [Candidatus Gottesmanbacteria bacterium GW2011_GWA2_43_14]
MSQLALERLRISIPDNRTFEPSFEVKRFDPSRIERLAEIIVNRALKIGSDDRLLLRYDPGGSQLAQFVAYKAAEKGAAVLPRSNDPLVLAAVLAGVAQNETPRVFNEMAAGENGDISWATKVSIIRSSDFPEAMDVVPGDISKKWNQATEAALRLRVDRRPWNLIYLPTEAEAKIDGMNYEDYLEMFFRACDRPWDQIDAAQEILANEILNPGKQLELFGGEKLEEKWRTYLTMSIEDQTFANSTIDRNIPGSEVFSSPNRGTINGRLALPYPVMFAGRRSPNLILEFKDGKVVNFEVESDNLENTKWMESALNADEGAREVGEVALGTNRVFNRPMLNGLFVEKVGGSFHIAIGSSYLFTEYNGKLVHLDNGVRSVYHEDLTCMMLPEFGGGRVLIDGKLIQENGNFLDPRLAVLNLSF